MQTLQNMIQKPLSVKQKTGLTAFFVYLAILLAPNPQVFVIRISEGLHLTPMRYVLLIIGFITTLNILNKKLNIIAIIQKCSLFLPLILLLTIKVTSLLYSSNYLGGMGAIAGFIEDILFAAVCYIYYVKGVIVPSKIILFIVAGFVLSISVAVIQILNFAFNFNLLLPLIDYVNLYKHDANLFKITGLSLGDVNVYATYVATVLLIIIAVFIYSKKYLLGTAIVFFVGSTVLFSIQSRSNVIIFVLILIYMIIRNIVIIKKQVFLLMIILLFIMMTLPSNTVDEFFEKYSNRYYSLINYIVRVDYEQEEENINAHRDMALKYFDLIDREPIAVITGVGEGDYLNDEGLSEKRGTGAHNAYVLILGENGPIAFLLFIYITWLILKASIFVNRNSSIPMAKSLLYHNIAYLLSFVLYGSQFLQPIFWGIIGITFAEKTRIEHNAINLRRT